MKPDCYSCVHRGTVPGSAHSSCHHQATLADHQGALAELARMFGKRSGLTILPTQSAADLRIELAELGVRNGWALWPVNFDPVWLERCDGFTPKPAAVEASS